MCVVVLLCCGLICFFYCLLPYMLSLSVLVWTILSVGSGDQMLDGPDTWLVVVITIFFTNSYTGYGSYGIHCHFPFLLTEFWRCPCFTSHHNSQTQPLSAWHLWRVQVHGSRCPFKRGGITSSGAVRGKEVSEWVKELAANAALLYACGCRLH